MAETVVSARGHQPAVAGLLGTHWLVVWADPDQAAIKGRLFHTGSDTGGAEFVVNASSEANTFRQRPAVCNIGDFGAGLVAVWVESALTPPGPRPHIKARRFDPEGRPVGSDFQVSLNDVDPAVRPSVVANGDGGFIVTWMDARPDQRVQTRRFRSDGTPSGGPFTNNQTPGFHKDPTVIDLVGPAAPAAAQGLCAWVRDPADVAGAIVVGRFFDLDTAPIDREFIPDRQHGFRDEGEVHALAALDTGQFVLSHVRHKDNPEPGVARSSRVEWWVYEPDGKPTFTTGFANGERLLSSCPRIAPLAGGRFLLTWTDKSATTVESTPTVQARIGTVADLTLPGPVSLSFGTAPDRRGLAAAAVAGGGGGEKALVAWTEVDRNGVSSVRAALVRIGPGGEVIP